MSPILSFHPPPSQPVTRGSNIGEAARPAKAGMFSGRQSHRGKSQGPVAWVAFAKETKRMKPTDKAALGAVSESPGRNESEPIGGLDTINPKAEPFGSGRRQHDYPQSDRSGRSLRRGGRGSTVARTCRATGETVLAPARNRWSKVPCITGATGKARKGETATARPVVAERRGNARGAKGPCCTECRNQQGRQGEMIKAPISLQDLRRRLYLKAKAERQVS